MTWRDKLEIGLKEDAPYRKDNLPPSQVRGPEVSKGEGRSPEIPLARADRIRPDARTAPSKPRRTVRVQLAPARGKAIKRKA
jgi:hypothetical protein